MDALADGESRAVIDTLGLFAGRSLPRCAASMQRGGRLSRWLIAALLVLARAVASAAAVEADPIPPIEWTQQQSALCGAAIHAAEQHHGLPSGLLDAIAKAESGRPVAAMDDIRAWPWTIDADGAGLFLDSKEAAVAWVTQQSARHRYIDVGCLQVDLAMHPRAFASLEEAFDPTANADYAARYLSDLYRGEAQRNWNIAVGLYHSHTPGLAADYRDRVAMTGARILHGVLEPVPLYLRAYRQGTLRLPLGNGRSTPIDVNRQPAARGHHRMSSCEIARLLGPYLSGAAGGSRCTTAPASR